MDEVYEVMHSIWGYDSFRDGQRRIIDALLDGRDVMAIMPTGSGKSLCYQVPALMFDGLTVVVSPLISLMHDQVAKLDAAGVAATYIDSTLPAAEVHKRLSAAKKGSFKLLYLSPERLQSSLLCAAALELDVCLLAVDEAHCVSKWGADFRPEYRQIPRFVGFLGSRPVIAAFTATAADDTRTEIAEALQLSYPELIVTGFARPNLNISVEEAGSKAEKAMLAESFLKARVGQSGIVYCLTRKEVEEQARALRLAGIDCLPYHAGLKSEAREKAQKSFLSGETRVIVATSAFGMGIDKPDVRFVLSLGMRDSIEDYYQNIGRAGRDGRPADCHLIWSKKDISLWKWLFKKSLEGSRIAPQAKSSLLQRREAELAKMVAYCISGTCRHVVLLNHFGEGASGSCGTCDNCRRREARNSATAAPIRPDAPAANVTRSGKVRLSYSERAAMR